MERKTAREKKNKSVSTEFGNERTNRGKGIVGKNRDSQFAARDRLDDFHDVDLRLNYSRNPRRKEHVVETPNFLSNGAGGRPVFCQSLIARLGPTRARRPILLLHGLPSSSRMFEPLFKRLFLMRYTPLSRRTTPGLVHSDWARSKKRSPTPFDHYAEIMNRFTEALGLSQ